MKSVPQFISGKPASGRLRDSVPTAVLVALLMTSVLPVRADSEFIEITAPSVAAPVPFEIGDTPEGEFTGYRDVIEKEQLQQAGSSLAEVLATQSGVQFRQSGGLGSYSTVSLRGSTSEQVNVYLDGVLLNEAAGGGVNLSNLELLEADRVEVYRGSVPVQLGNSAIGGAVNITSARAGETPVTSLLAGVGSFGSSRFSSAYRGPLSWLNKQSLVATFSHRQSANDFPFLNDNGTVFNTEDDQQQHRTNGQTQSTSAFAKTAHVLQNGAKLSHALQLSQYQQGISDWRNTASASASLDSDNLQWSSTLARSASAERWSSLWGAHYGTRSEVYDDSGGSIGLGQKKILTDSRVLGGRTYWEKILQDQSLSFNVRARVETFDSSNALQVANATRASRLRTDVNLQWNRYFKNRSSLLSASLFGFTVKDDYKASYADTERADFSDTALVPQFGLHHKLGEALGGQWSLTANAARHKRVPSFFELFGSQGLFEGNAGLQAENSDNIDLGLGWRSDAAAKVDATVQLAWFQSSRNNLITRVYDAQGVGQSQNISRAKTNGIELMTRLQFDNGYSVDANATVQDAQNRSAISGYTGRQLPGEAAVDGTVVARWKNASWKVEYEYKFNSDRYYDSANFLGAADQRIHGARVSRYWKNWQLDLEINNITNQIYEDFNGYPKPGRAGFISVMYHPQPEIK